MLAMIIDLEQIESNDIQHTYTGQDEPRWASDYVDYILTDISVDILKADGTSKAQIKCFSPKDRSILFKKQDIDFVV